MTGIQSDPEAPLHSFVNPRAKLDPIDESRPLTQIRRPGLLLQMYPSASHLVPIINLSSSHPLPIFSPPTYYPVRAMNVGLE